MNDDFYLLTLAGIAREMHREHLTRTSILPPNCPSHGYGGSGSRSGNI